MEIILRAANSDFGRVKIKVKDWNDLMERLEKEYHCWVIDFDRMEAIKYDDYLE